MVDFRCRAHVEPEGPEEPNPTHSIVFVRRGVFRTTARGAALVADANHVLFFNQAQPYRFSHPLPGGDDCTILAVETPVARQLVARVSPWDAERAEAPFPLAHGLCTPRAARLHYELLTLARRGAPPLDLEDGLAELADEALGAAYRTHERRTERDAVSPAARRRRRELVEATALALHGRPDQPPSLAELAEDFGCSPFHLSRTFHREAGLSLRRYGNRLRARLAADRLAAGAPDLTAVALDYGFADHSHFTNAFRQEWGVPPSKFRARHAAR